MSKSIDELIKEARRQKIIASIVLALLIIGLLASSVLLYELTNDIQFIISTVFLIIFSFIFIVIVDHLSKN